jgi:hypothetical protein
MHIRTRIAVVVLWIASLFTVAAIASAQLGQVVPLPEPKVFTGTDIGFRVEGSQGDTPVGHIVVKVDGKWVEAQMGPAAPKLASAGGR